jgi:tRNA dimethylallyltransferase
MIPLITVEGATASGKTGLALALARSLGTEIISADSRQVYRYLDIGTAKPGRAERQQVPHHLIDIIDPDESYNAGMFCADAMEAINGLSAKGMVPIVCGGTGMYVSSLLNGLFELPPVPSALREELKLRIEREGLPALYGELSSADPGFAARISSSDRQRILRGLEVYLATGKPITAHWREQQRSERFRCFRLLIDLPRELLYQRIGARMQAMVESGLAEEIRSILNRGYSTSSPGLNSLGYKEFIPYLSGLSPLGDCLDKASQHTRNYAKRQVTWYRKHKFDLTLRSPDLIISSIVQQIKDVLRIN